MQEEGTVDIDLLKKRLRNNSARKKSLNKSSSMYY